MKKNKPDSLNNDDKSFEKEMDAFDPMTIVKKDVDQALTSFVGINDIEGLEEVAANTIPLPFCRLVQPTSTKIALSDGKDAAAGTFFFNDTQTVEEELNICILKAKHSDMTFERDGMQVPVKKLGILAVDMNNLNKIFILSLSVMSFTSFGSLIAKIRADQQVSADDAKAKVRDYVIKVTSEKQENDKGKYYIAKFEIVEKVAKDHKEKMDDLYQKYINSLERNNPEGGETK